MTASFLLTSEVQLCVALTSGKSRWLGPAREPNSAHVGLVGAGGPETMAAERIVLNVE